ncbi:uncharacterized protein [Coffea arabica]|uniref:RNA-directed DNA polymerase (Reverse transcriptase) n=1 Tax=Coffea arabica TaxID=13443 RepID=A0ABM4WPQ9_COFAR
MDNSFTVQHLGRDPSDHAPLLLSASTMLDNKPKPFWFLNVWTSKEGFLDVVKQCWADDVPGSPLRVLSIKLGKMKNSFKRWSREMFEDIFMASKDAEREVMEAEVAYDNDPIEQLLLKLQKARVKLRNTLAVEEGFSRQKARVRWLKDGDRNSKYFHSLVAERRSRALIHHI